MELAKKLTIWFTVVVGVSVVCVAWRSISGDVTWTHSIAHGELVLVAVTLTASAVGFAAMTSFSGSLDLLKAAVIGFGIIDLVLSIGVYASFSDPSQTVAHSPRSVAHTSYILLGVSVVIGLASTYLTHRAD